MSSRQDYNETEQKYAPNIVWRLQIHSMSLRTTPICAQENQMELLNIASK